MNPYTHEITHLLRSRTMIAVIVLTALSGSVGYLDVESAVGSNVFSSSGVWWAVDGDYHMEVWVFNVAGSLEPGVTLDLVVEKVTPSFYYPPPGVVVANETKATGADGGATFEFALPNLTSTNSSYVASFVASYASLPSVGFEGPIGGERFDLSSSSGGSGNVTAVRPLTDAGVGGGAIASPGAGPTVPRTVLGDPINPVSDGFYSAGLRQLVVFAGPDGGPPVGDRLVYCDVPSYVPTFPGPFGSPGNCTGAQSIVPLGPLTGSATLFPDPPPPPPSASASESQIEEIVNSSGGIEYAQSTGGRCFGPGPCPAPTSASPGPGILNGWAGGFLSLLLPLMAVLVTYWIYARPRLSGTLEPVLARPVTRRGLFLARAAAIGIAMVIAVVAELLLLELLVAVLLQEPLPLGFFAPLLGGLLVASLGTVGIVLGLSHSLRSPGLVLAIGLAVVLVTGVFWGVLIALLGGAVNAGATPASQAAFHQLTERLQLVAPALLPQAVTGTLTRLSVTGDLDGFALAGVTAGAIGLAGLLWVVVPIALSYWRAGRHD